MKGRCKEKYLKKRLKELLKGGSSFFLSRKGKWFEKEKEFSFFFLYYEEMKKGKEGG